MAMAVGTPFALAISRGVIIIMCCPPASFFFREYIPVQLLKKNGGIRNYGTGEKGGLGIPEKEWEVYGSEFGGWLAFPTVTVKFP